MPAQVAVGPQRSLSHKKLRRRALSLARRSGKDHVLVVRRLEPPGLTEDFAVAVTGEGPLPGLTPPLEAYRLYLDGREEPVRGLRFVGVDRRALRDILHAGPVSPPVGVLDGPPGASRFSLGSVSGLPASWSVPPVLVSELELTARTTGESRVLQPPP